MRTMETLYPNLMKVPFDGNLRESLNKKTTAKQRRQLNRLLGDKSVTAEAACSFLKGDKTFEDVIRGGSKAPNGQAARPLEAERVQVMANAAEAVVDALPAQEEPGAVEPVADEAPNQIEAPIANEHIIPLSGTERRSRELSLRVQNEALKDAQLNTNLKISGIQTACLIEGGIFSVLPGLYNVGLSLFHSHALHTPTVLQGSLSLAVGAGTYGLVKKAVATFIKPSQESTEIKDRVMRNLPILSAVAAAGITAYATHYFDMVMTPASLLAKAGIELAPEGAKTALFDAGMALLKHSRFSLGIAAALQFAKH